MLIILFDGGKVVIVNSVWIIFKGCEIYKKGIMLDIVVKDICFLVLFNFSGSGVVFGIILIFIVGD